VNHRKQNILSWIEVLHVGEPASDIVGSDDLRHTICIQAALDDSSDPFVFLWT
jgi:hypothetical protein